MEKAEFSHFSSFVKPLDGHKFFLCISVLKLYFSLFIEDCISEEDEQFLIPSRPGGSAHEFLIKTARESGNRAKGSGNSSRGSGNSAKGSGNSAKGSGNSTKGSGLSPVPATCTTTLAQEPVLIKVCIFYVYASVYATILSTLFTLAPLVKIAPEQNFGTFIII